MGKIRVLALPDKSIDKHPLAMAQIGGMKRAEDIHKEMVDGFDDYHKEMIKSVDREVKRLM
jgi:hypothetical protein